MTRRLILLVPVVCAVVGGYFALERMGRRADASRILGQNADAGGSGTMTLLSRTHTLDRIYPSMHGPYENQAGIRLGGEGSGAIYWVTGIETQVVERDGETGMSPEFFCHANLTLSEEGNGPALHNAALGGGTHLDWRLFTLVPGRLSLFLPEGFGIPVRGNEALDFLGMSLNLIERDSTVLARFRTRIHYVADKDAGPSMKPLFRRAVYGYEPRGIAVEGAACVGGSHPGQSCGPFQGRSASPHDFVDAVGQERIIHWIVRPGRYEAHTDVTDQLDLPFDTSVHYATGHLHPHGRSLTFVDVTVGDTLLAIRSDDFDDRLGVARMDEVVLPEGVLLARDHRYELITEYDNTTGKDIDAMAILYLYCLDRSFRSESASLAP
jgi:hypothetical protein